MWQTHQARTDCGPGEVEGICGVPGEALPGVRHIGGVTTEVDGKGGTLEVENGIPSGQDRENEGSGGGPRRAEWSYTTTPKSTKTKVTDAKGETNKAKQRGQDQSIPIFFPAGGGLFEKEGQEPETRRSG